MQFSTAAALTAIAAVLSLGNAAPTDLEQPADGGNMTTMAEGLFQAFSGGSCNGNAGSKVGFSCKAQVLVWNNSKCRGTFKQYTVNAGSCVGVNTGLNWRSASAQCA
ncbi:hypothetical protein PGQ11_015256 [Apiospora arundinis]|uniref:Uncharacterized protein n=1 Tax=Apiospora arundinis TaxID=335852 RepID=A0ABR2HKW7_9PEZI